jgi:DNA-binding response OmpR family regulator
MGLKPQMGLRNVDKGVSMVSQSNTSSPAIKLLFVDDEKGFVDVVSKRLAKRAIQSTKAYSGAEAILALRREDFDLALLDLKMDDLDGIEVLKIFKKMSPALKVIMLTGHGSEEAAREGIRCGAADYLTKPCDFEDLVEKIRSVCARTESLGTCAHT